MSQLPVQRGQFDMSRLQLLNANADKSALSTDEAKAVASHLMANVPQVGTEDITSTIGKTRRKLSRRFGVSSSNLNNPLAVVTISFCLFGCVSGLLRPYLSLVHLIPPAHCAICRHVARFT